MAFASTTTIHWNVPAPSPDGRVRGITVSFEVDTDGAGVVKQVWKILGPDGVEHVITDAAGAVLVNGLRPASISHDSRR